MGVEISQDNVLTAALGVKDLISRGDLPGRLSAKVARLARLIEPELMDLQKVEQQIQERHFKRNEDGSKVEATTPDGTVMKGQYVLEDPEAFWKELQELRESKVEISFTPFVDSDFAEVTISPETLIRLGDLVVEG